MIRYLLWEQHLGFPLLQLAIVSASTVQRRCLYAYWYVSLHKLYCSEPVSNLLPGFCAGGYDGYFRHGAAVAAAAAATTGTAAVPVTAIGSTAVN